MDETLWKLFWTTGLPEAYALAKEGGQENETEQFAEGSRRDAPAGPQ